MNSKKRERVKLRLSDYDYAQKGLYFVTICTHRKKCLFGDINDNVMQLNDAGRMVEYQWHDLENRYKNIKLHEYVVMPNHLHGIIEIVQKDRVLGACPRIGIVAKESWFEGYFSLI